MSGDPIKLGEAMSPRGFITSKLDMYSNCCVFISGCSGLPLISMQSAESDLSGEEKGLIPEEKSLFDSLSASGVSSDPKKLKMSSEVSILYSISPSECISTSFMLVKRWVFV